MAKLVWDQVGQHFYETGVSNCVLFPMTGTTYGNGVAWNGITSVSESPSGAEETEIYADNIKYLSLRSAEKFGFTIEAYTYPDEWMQCDGSAEIGNGMVVGQQGRKSFGLVYKTLTGNDTEGNEHGYKLHIIYGATASPSERAYSTVNDSPEAITFSWECATIPVQPTDATLKPVSCVTVDSIKAGTSKMEALEALVFGSESAEASLPDIDTLIGMFKTA